MLRPDLIRPNNHRRGQALVEFTLTALVFLLLLVMIIEVARIMQAYITLQNAARRGARYAVTGQWISDYGDNPMHGWVVGSTNPLERIAPCWPLFNDDPADPTPANPSYYQPYRNARTCSVEDQTIRGLTGLPLDPTASSGEPNYYQIVVSGVGDSVDPSSTFQRGFAVSDPNYGSYPHPQFDLYTGTYSAYGYTTTGGSGTNAELFRGFAGKPEQKVVVQIEYRVGMVTPLVSAIVPSLRLTAAAIMTNEGFGSTGLQREAILPPNLPPVPTLGVPVPPDLIVESVTPSVSTAAPGQDITFTIVVKNQGEQSVTGTNVLVRLYYSTGAAVNLQTPLSGVTQIGETSFTDLALQSSTTVTITANFPSAEIYYIYAWVDPTDVINEAGDVGSEVYDLTREQNNATASATQPMTIQDQSDLELVGMTALPIMPAVGGTVTYTITVKNNGPSDADQIEVTDTLPAGLGTMTANTAPGGCLIPAGSWVCSIGTLTAGGSSTFDLTLTVTGAGTITNPASVATTNLALPDPNPANNAKSLVIYAGGVDLGITKSVNPATQDVGQQAIYTITVDNTADSDATGVQISDTPSTADLAVVSATATSGTFGAGGWNVGTVPAHGSETLTLTVAPGATTAGTTINNTAQVTAVNETDPFPSNDQASAALYVPGVDLISTLAVDDNTPYEGQQIIYTVTARNLGPDPATNVTMSVPVVAGLTFVSDTAGGAYNSGSGLWTIGSINVGQTKTITITARPNVGTAPSTITMNTSNLVGTQGETNAANNNASIGVTVHAPNADLSVQKTVQTSSPYYEGQQITYRITVTNNGPDQTTNVVIQDTPTGVTYVSGTATQGTFTTANGRWTIGTMNSGATETLTLVTTVNAGTGGGTVRNAAAVYASDWPDLTSGNNSDSKTVNVTVAYADLGVTISVDDSTPNVGQYMNYTITVHNYGPLSTTGVQVTDLLPYSISRSCSASVGSYSCTTGIWNIGTLTSGQIVTMTLTSRPRTGTSGQTIGNTASVTASALPDPSPDPHPNSATVNITVN